MRRRRIFNVDRVILLLARTELQAWFGLQLHLLLNLVTFSGCFWEILIEFVKAWNVNKVSKFFSGSSSVGTSILFRNLRLCSTLLVFFAIVRIDSLITINGKIAMYNYKRLSTRSSWESICPLLFFKSLLTMLLLVGWALFIGVFVCFTFPVCYWSFPDLLVSKTRSEPPPVKIYYFYC